MSPSMSFVLTPVYIFQFLMKFAISKRTCIRHPFVMIDVNTQPHPPTPRSTHISNFRCFDSCARRLKPWGGSGGLWGLGLFGVQRVAGGGFRVVGIGVMHQGGWVLVDEGPCWVWDGPFTSPFRASRLRVGRNFPDRSPARPHKRYRTR